MKASGPQAWRLVIDGFQRLMQSLSFTSDLIAGIETAGIPHGATLAYQMGKPFVFGSKQAKDHGGKKLVEGAQRRRAYGALLRDFQLRLPRGGAAVWRCARSTSYVGHAADCSGLGAATGPLRPKRTRGITGLGPRPAGVGSATGGCEMTVIDKYNVRVDAANSLVCVGLDSDHRRLPERFAGSATPQFDFNRWVIDQTHEFASAYKPNIAFYEARLR